MISIFRMTWWLQELFRMFCDLHHGSLKMVLTQIVLAGGRIGDLCCGEELSENYATSLLFSCARRWFSYLIAFWWLPMGGCRDWCGWAPSRSCDLHRVLQKGSDLILGYDCFRMMCNIHLVCERILWFDNVRADERLLAVRWLIVLDGWSWNCSVFILMMSASRMNWW